MDSDRFSRPGHASSSAGDSAPSMRHTSPSGDREAQSRAFETQNSTTSNGGHIPPPGEPTPKPKLLVQVRDMLRALHYANRTEEASADWIRRSILFHHKRHPLEMGVVEVEALLTHLAVERNFSASTPNQALAALLFLD